MKHFKYILFTLTLLVNTFYSKAQWPPTDPAYSMTFGDDFTDTTGYNGKIVNYSKWVTHRPWNNDATTKMVIYKDVNPHDTVVYDVAGYNFNQYDTNNVHVITSGVGICRLIARKEIFITTYWDWNTPPYYFQDTFKYSNGSLASTKKFRFGYFEIKFRLPSNISTPNIDNNYLPTCWLFTGGATLTPSHSEIDIYEIDGRTNDFTNSVYFQHDTSYYKFGDHAANIATVSSGVWHTASVDWTKEHIDFYYDGNFIRRETAHADSLDAMSALIEAYVPNEWSRRNVDPVNTAFPYVYEIDYYKVYQINEDCSNSKTYTNATAATFESKLYKDLTLNTNCYFNNGTVSALGNDFVLLDEGTTIDNNMTMYIDVKPCNGNVLAPAITQMPTPGTDIFQQSRVKQ